MGTRHLTIVQLNNEIKVAQYGQWDGYPGGQGRTVKEFIQGAKMDVFRERLKSCYFLTDEKIKELYEKEGITGEFMNMEQAERFKSKHPQLDRDMGAEVLNYIYASEGDIPLQNNISFAGDSLFCEWAWLVNMDTNELEVYHGFNKTTLGENERFRNAVKAKSSPEYEPIALLHKWKFEEIPADDDEFVEFLEKKASQEEEVE